MTPKDVRMKGSVMTGAQADVALAGAGRGNPDRAISHPWTQAGCGDRGSSVCGEHRGFHQGLPGEREMLGLASLTSSLQRHHRHHKERWLCLHALSSVQCLVQVEEGG